MEATGLEHLSDKDLLDYHRKYEEQNRISSRFEMVKTRGYDVKFAYHVLRLFDEAQQLLETGEMDLQRAKESMKAIRRGDWKMEQLIDWASAKENELELAFTNCSLPPKPDEARLKKLLIECLEEHYGTLSSVFQQPDWSMMALKDIDERLNEVRNKLYGGQ